MVFGVEHLNGLAQYAVLKLGSIDLKDSQFIQKLYDILTQFFVLLPYCKKTDNKLKIAGCN